MKKETILNVISTCMIIVGSGIIGAAIGTCIEHNENKARNKELMDSIALNNAAIKSMKQLVDVNNDRIIELKSKMFDLRCELDNVE